jgi:predicted amidophosphoribosyltransferase
MPDESCRNCGAELHVQSTCSECHEPIQQICPECTYAPLERIHSDCTLGLEVISTSSSPGQTHQMRAD